MVILKQVKPSSDFIFRKIVRNRLPVLVLVLVLVMVSLVLMIESLFAENQ